MGTTKNHGVVAYFKSPEELLSAVKAVRGKGVKEVETFTPFPIHGIDEALGLKPSIVPWATFFCGLTGFALAVHMQVWTSAYDWPINVGGKPMVSLPAFFPIFFELTVLLGGLGTAAFMLFLNGLPNFRPSALDKRVTDDRFAVYIPFAGNSQSADELERMLKDTHPENISSLSEPI